MSTRTKRIITIAALWVGAAVAGRLVSARLSHGDERSDELALAAILWGQQFASRAGALRSASVTAVMGGVDLDLRGAQLDPASARLDVRAFMGGVKVTVPEGWTVETDATAFAGGVDSRVPSPVAGTELPCLRVRARVAMGGVTIVARP